MYPDAPRVAVGAVVFNEMRVLLVLRKQTPAEGLWAIPGGSVNLGETLQEAAEREVLEETGLRIKAGDVIYNFEVIERDDRGDVRYHYVILDLAAQLLDTAQTPRAADDVADVGWFTLADVVRTDLPVSETTRELLKEIMKG
jgi:ADP-ribose pyrophosphatase